MPKVVRLFNEQERSQQQLIKHIEEFLQAAKDGNITNFIAAAQHVDGDVITGYVNLGVGERQYMLGHIQSDITMAVVEANIDKLIELID